MKHLYVIRHGQSVANVAGVLSGHTDHALTDEGRAQARRAGEQAKELGIDYIVSSPLARAYETAKIIAREIGYPTDGIEVNPLLIKRNFGTLEGTPYTPDYDADGIEGAEREHELRARAEQLYDYLRTIDADNVLLVSHGSTARMIRSVVVPHVPFRSDAPGHHFPNAEIVQLV